MANPLAADLEHVLAHTREIWEEFRGQRLFLTGGTGFIGCWLLETFLWANERLGLGASAVVLTRNPEAFAQKARHLARHRDIHLHVGNVRSFAFPDGAFRYVIHAATESSTTPRGHDSRTMLDTIVRGTERALEFSQQCGVEKFLLTSSGAVYGPQPAELTHLPEDYRGGPDPTDVGSAYAEGKRVAEHLCAVYHQRFGLQAKIARCFAFLGPYLPLDGHFAAGNFLRDGLAGGPIRVRGDGTPCRSYLYAADLMIWLWSILSRGAACRPYNVGCDQSVTIGALAQQVANHFGTDVRTEQRAVLGQPPQKYVPNVTRAKHELGLRAWITLADAIARTAAWHERVSTVSRRAATGFCQGTPDPAPRIAPVS